MPTLTVSSRPRSPPWVGRPWVVLFLVFATFAGVAGAAADAGRRRFDIPAGAAVTTIKRAALQAGLEIVYSASVVDGVPTPAVVGEFRPREGIERLLAGTGLRLVEDKQTGVLSVSRETAAQPKARPPESGPSAAAPIPPPDPPKTNQPKHTESPSMKNRNFCALLAGWLIAGPALEAQTASTLPKDEAVVLSPFTVNAERDTGYQATSTLAGTRLNTPVKDLGAAISIYTKDFLDDIGAITANDFLIYATGMEAAGPGGNYSGATSDINATQVIGDSPRINPQSGRTRGLASPTYSRGFFLTNIVFDSYNTERMTVNRGPNAALFGVGSPAGVVDTSLIRPDLQRNKNKVEMRYGNNDSVRAAVDFNRVLIPKKLALRLAALHDRDEYNQRPAFEEKKRIYGALTFEPFKSTSLRVNFESGNAQANRPMTVMPLNSISQAWLAAGRPSYDWSFYDDPARNPNAAVQTAGTAPYDSGFLAGQAFLFDQLVVAYSNPAASTPNSAYRSTTPNTGATAANAIKNQVFNPLVNRDLGTDTIQFLGTRNIFEFPAGYWTGANVLSGQLSGLAPAGIKNQAFTNFSAFDFKNRILDETSRQGNSFRAFNVTLEQRAWHDRVGFELAYDTQRADRHSKNSFFSLTASGSIRVDTNVTLPTGQPNPNLGRPYAVFGQSDWTNNFKDSETKRATGYFTYDCKDMGTSWGKWLGRHTFTGLYEQNAAETINYNHRIATDGDAARAINPDIGVFGRRPAVVVYLGPSIIGNNNPLQLQPIQIPAQNAGPVAVPARYFLRAANATDPGAFVDSPTTFVEINNGGTAQRDVIKSQAAVLQSYWLRDHLITLVGWRRDEDYFVRQSFNYAINPLNTNDPGKVHYGFEDFSFPNTPPPNVAKEVKSFSAVLRWPQKLIKLPANADVSVFINESGNFTASGGRVNPFGEALASPQGKTREYGFNLSILNDRLSLRVNWFENSVQGQSFTPTVVGTATGNAVLQVASAWAVEGNINPQLATQRNADIELLFSALPTNYRQYYGWQVTGTAPNLASRFSTGVTSSDTTDFTAKGTEIELVYNPTSNWRILANVAKQETVQSNSLPFLKRFIALMMPAWTKLKNTPRTSYPAGWQPGASLGNTELLGTYLDANVLVPFATATATEGSASAEQRKWRANLVTNYTFGRGAIFGEKLKGWGVGAAVRWQDRIGIGYPTSRNPDSSVMIDLAHPYYSPPETNVDAWVSYGCKLWNDRINWKVQLNVRNLYGETDPIAIAVQPWGEVSATRLAPERRWYLTNTFSF